MKMTLSQYRLKQAKERFKAAEVLFDSGNYADSLSRSYYTMFTSARALLATKSLDSRKHSGVIALFNQYFVKEGIVNSNMGRLIAEAKGVREESDYGDYVTFTKGDAETQLNHAKEFIKEIERVL